jgi:hypothetical protein
VILDILLGMCAPLVVASVSWVLMARTYARDPGNLTAMMIAAFAVKMVVFGAYVALMIAVVKVKPAPFAAAFTLVFVASYVVEAMLLRRLFNLKSEL